MLGFQQKSSEIGKKMQIIELNIMKYFVNTKLLIIYYNNCTEYVR